MSSTAMLAPFCRLRRQAVFLNLLVRRTRIFASIRMSVLMVADNLIGTR